MSPLKRKLVASTRLKRVLFKILKIFAWIVGSVIILLIALCLAIRIPSIQNKIVQKAVSFLQNKIGTRVTLKSITISFPKQIVLEDLFLADQSKDTLVFVGRLGVDTDLWGLTKHQIELDKIELDHFKAHVRRTADDSLFNYDYILKAFASPPSPDTTTSGWQFSLDKVALTRSLLSYHDGRAGDNADVALGNFALRFGTFDLQKSIFKADQITMENSRLTVLQSGSKVIVQPRAFGNNAPHDTTSPVFVIGANQINLTNVNISYANDPLGQAAKASIGKLTLTPKSIDLKEQKIDLDKFELDNSFLSYQQRKGQTKTHAAMDTTNNSASATSWSFTLGALTLNNNNLQYYDFTKPAVTRAIDFNHLWLMSLNASARDISLHGHIMNASINNLSLREKSGFDVQSLSGEVKLNDTSLGLRNVTMITGKSKLSINATASFASFDRIATDYAQADIQLDIKHSIIALKDILFFNPALTDSLPVKLPANSRVAIDAAVKGKLASLDIARLTIATFDSTLLRAHGSIKNLPDVQHALMAIDLDDLHTTRADVKNVLPDTLIPSSIQVPEWVALKGKINGTIHSPDIDVMLTSDMGSISAIGKMTTDSALARYDATIEVKELQLGRLLKQEDGMGTLSLQATVNGAGLKMNELNSSLKCTIASLTYNKYTYKNFNIEGTFQKYLFSGNASYKDENLEFNLTGNSDYQKDVPEYHLVFDLKNGDFQKLHLSQDALKARGKMEVNLMSTDFKAINGNLNIHNVDIFNGKSLYSVDSLLYIRVEQKKESTIAIRSDVIAGDFKGSMDLLTLPTVLKQHLGRYFSSTTSAKHAPSVPQNFTFNLTLKNSDLLNDVILPDLQPSSPGRIRGEFNSEESKFNFRVDIGAVKYGTTSIDSLVVGISSDKNALNYHVSLKALKADTFLIDALGLTGSIAHDSIHSTFTILDSLSKEKYSITSLIKNEKDKMSFHLVPDKVMLNYKTWKVPADNFLEVNAKSIKANHCEITNEDESVSLTTDDKDATVAIGFRHLQLKNITSLVDGTIPIDGTLNGDLKFTKAKEAIFNSRLQITQFALMQKVIGDVTILLGHTEANKYTLALGISGNGSDVKAEGTYDISAKGSEMNINAAINRLNLELLEAVYPKHLKEVKGYAAGKIKITGSTTKPHIAGEISFNDMTFYSIYVSNRFSIKKETVVFNESGITINNFKILDDRNNVASIRGDIKTEDYSLLRLNLQMTSKDFRLFNSAKKGNNQMVYGKLSMSLDAKIYGTSNHPRVDLHAGFSNDTDFTYVIPPTEKEVLAQKGIVVFIDKDAKKDPFLAGIHPVDTAKTVFKGVEVTANIELTGKETFNIIIDPATNDKLTVQGISNLTFQMDESGNMNLTGRYEIVKGSYSLSFYKIANRKFEIEKGSTILWTGDPYNATMDIRARYDVEVSPMELVSSQSGQLSQDEINMYKQRLAFQVYLLIKGQLLTPDISFQLDMPYSDKAAFGGAIYAKIQDVNTREADLNKQVFGLLILKRFVADNPFDSQSGSDANNTARMSVGNLLTQQLNQLSQNVKGVKLSVDLKSYDDYSTGREQGQTQLQVGVSKNLFSDRLVVKLSGNVDIEGENTQNNATDYIGDLALEYRLTEDGRYRITGFRNGNYDMIDGELIETGAGFIFIKDYNTLSELLKPNANKK